MADDKPFSDLQIAGEFFDSPEIFLLAGRMSAPVGPVSLMILYFWNTVRLRSPRGRISADDCLVWIEASAARAGVACDSLTTRKLLVNSGWLVQENEYFVPVGWDKRYAKIFNKRAKDAEIAHESRTSRARVANDSMSSLAPNPNPNPKKKGSSRSLGVISATAPIAHARPEESLDELLKPQEPEGDA